MILWKPTRPPCSRCSTPRGLARSPEGSSRVEDLRLSPHRSRWRGGGRRPHPNRGSRERASSRLSASRRSSDPVKRVRHSHVNARGWSEVLAHVRRFIAVGSKAGRVRPRWNHGDSARRGRWQSYGGHSTSDSTGTHGSLMESYRAPATAKGPGNGAFFVYFSRARALGRRASARAPRRWHG